MLNEHTRLFLLAIGLVWFPNHAASAEWYAVEGESCSGNTTLSAAVMAITGGGVQVGGSTGAYYAIVPAAQLSAFAKPNSERIDGKKQLTQQTAASLRGVFAGVAGDMKVPMWVNVGTNLFVGLSLPARTGTAMGLMFNYLFSLKDTNAQSVQNVVPFIAEGGSVYNRATLLQRVSDQSLFLAYSTEYQVSVGAETRSFAVYACMYPLDVIVNEFETVAPLFDPRYPHLVKKRPDSRWQEWDTQDNKYIFEPLDYQKQEGEYYYFETDVIENSKVIGGDLERISVLGGKWQRMDYDTRPNGPWKNLMLKMVAR
jgi:hypothetical protein